MLYSVHAVLYCLVITTLFPHRQSIQDLELKQIAPSFDSCEKLEPLLPFCSLAASFVK